MFFNRSDGQYSSMKHAQARSDAYKAAVNEWSSYGDVVLVSFDSEFSIEEIVDFIIEDLRRDDGQ